MALVLPDPGTPLSSETWDQALSQLSDLSGIATPDLSLLGEGGLIATPWYPSLALMARQYEVPIPDPNVPLAIGNLISPAWYPALRKLVDAANV